MKVIIASNDVTADDVLAIALLAVAANKTPRRGSSRGRETPLVIRTNEAEVIQEALEDKNVYVLGGGRTSPLRKNFDGDVLSSVIKYLEGYFPEGWQAPELSLTGDFSADLARTIELVKEIAYGSSHSPQRAH